MQHGPRSIVQCELVDLSLGGMAVLSRVPLMPRQRTRVETSFRGVPLVLDAMVVRRKRTREGYVLGLRFTLLDGEARRGLEEVLRTMQVRTALARQACVFFDRLPQLEVPAHASSVPLQPSVPQAHSSVPSVPVPQAHSSVPVPQAYAPVPSAPLPQAHPSIPPAPAHPSVPTSTPSWAATGSHPAVTTQAMGPTTPPDAASYDSSPRWDRTMIAPLPVDAMPPAPAAQSSVPLDAGAWDDDELDTRLAHDLPAPPPPPADSSVPLDAGAWDDDELDTRLAHDLPAPPPPPADSSVPLDAGAWDDDELDTRLAHDLPAPPPPPADSSVPLDAGAWDDDELDTRLAHDLPPPPAEPSVPLDGTAWSDDELDTNLMGEPASVLTDELGPRMSEPDDGPKLGDAITRVEAQGPLMTGSEQPHVHRAPQGYLEQADPFDPFLPVPERGRDEVGLPSVDESEETFGFEAISGLYQSPRAAPTERAPMPHAPRSPSGPMSDDDRPDADSTRARLELGDQLARMISAELVLGVPPGRSVAEEPPPEEPDDEDRTEVEPSTHSTTIPHLDLAPWQIETLTRAEHEDTRVEPRPSDADALPAEDFPAPPELPPLGSEDSLELEGVPLPEPESFGVSEVVEDDHTQVALHVPMPPSDDQDDFGAPSDAVTGFTMVMHVDDLLAAAELGAPQPVDAPGQPSEPAVRSGDTVQIDLREGLAWTADPTTSSPEVSWDTGEAPSPAAWETSASRAPAPPPSAYLEHAPLDLDLGEPEPEPEPAEPDESSLPRLSEDLQAALAQLRKRGESASETDAEPPPGDKPRKSRRRKRPSRQWGNDAPEAVELYRAALAQLDSDD